MSSPFGWGLLLRLGDDVALVVDGDFDGLAGLRTGAAPDPVIVLLEAGDAVDPAMADGAVLGLAFGEAVGALERRAFLGLARRVDVGLAGIHELGLGDAALGGDRAVADAHQRDVAHG